MAKYAQRNELNEIIGFTAHPSQRTDKAPVDESSQEWQDYLNPPIKKPTNQELIAALEKSVTKRRSREALLTQEGKDWLKSVDDQIVALRG